MNLFRNTSILIVLAVCFIGLVGCGDDKPSATTDSAKVIDDGSTAIAVPVDHRKVDLTSWTDVEVTQDGVIVAVQYDRDAFISAFSESHADLITITTKIDREHALLLAERPTTIAGNQATVVSLENEPEPEHGWLAYSWHFCTDWTHIASPEERIYFKPDPAKAQVAAQLQDLGLPPDEQKKLLQQLLDETESPLDRSSDG